MLDLNVEGCSKDLKKLLRYANQRAVAGDSLILFEIDDPDDDGFYLGTGEQVVSTMTNGADIQLIVKISAY